jgi:hypothetical protein
MQNWLADAAMVEAVLISFAIALLAAFASLRWIFMLMPFERQNSTKSRSAADRAAGVRPESSGRRAA